MKNKYLGKFNNVVTLRHFFSKKDKKVKKDKYKIYWISNNFIFLHSKTNKKLRKRDEKAMQVKSYWKVIEKFKLHL